MDFFIVNVEAAIYKEDKWLIIKRSEKEEHAPGILAFPGGKVDSEGFIDDILEKTIKREIMEEVGIEINDNLHYLESKEFNVKGKEKVIDIIFVCKYKSGDAKAISKDEVDNVKWMKIEEILENKLSPIWLKNSIKKAENFRLDIPY